MICFSKPDTNCQIIVEDGDTITTVGSRSLERNTPVLVLDTLDHFLHDPYTNIRQEVNCYQQNEYGQHFKVLLPTGEFAVMAKEWLNQCVNSRDSE